MTLTYIDIQIRYGSCGDDMCLSFCGCLLILMSMCVLMYMVGDMNQVWIWTPIFDVVL